MNGKGKDSFIHNERWQNVATYRADDDEAKEFFVYHNAGLDGHGGSSYIDAVIVREKDYNSGWTSAADGTLEQRHYYCQNWRSDVVALVGSDGRMLEWVKYSSYGIPLGMPCGDTDSDGDCDQTDIDNIDNWTSGYDVRYDTDLNGLIEAADSTRASTFFQGTTMGWNVLTNPDVGNRKGYAGYEYDEAVSKYHVRFRVLDPALGRWLRRDPLLGMRSLTLMYRYAANPMLVSDPTGLFARPRIEGDCAESLVNRCQGAYWDMILEAYDAWCAADKTKLTHCKDGWTISCSRPEGENPKACCLDCTVRLTPDSDCQHLIHEMIHAIDYCQTGNCGKGGGGSNCGGPVEPNKPLYTECDYQLCQELRAIHYQCCASTETRDEYVQCFDEWSIDYIERWKTPIGEGGCRRHEDNPKESLEDLKKCCIPHDGDCREEFDPFPADCFKRGGRNIEGSLGHNVVSAGIGCYCGGPCINCAKPCCH